MGNWNFNKGERGATLKHFCIEYVYKKSPVTNINKIHHMQGNLSKYFHDFTS